MQSSSFPDIMAVCSFECREEWVPPESFRDSEIKQTMKKTRAVVSLAAAVLVTFAAGCATEPSPEQLRTQAKLSQPQAEEIALRKAPGGTVKSAELEKEKGRLVWSFDIATPGTENVTEVLVDAVTGNIVSTEIETPAKEAGEARRKAK